MDSDAILLVVLIFGLRVLNNAISTFRLIIMTRGQRRLSFVLAFIESTIFAFTAAQVLTDLNNLANLFAYSGGFAVGAYVGILIEDRLITGYRVVHITTATNGHEIAQALGERGFGVTESTGEGVQGKVTMVRCVVDRKQVTEVARIVQAVQPNAFITVEEARSVQHGWLRQRQRMSPRR